jgi:hypothetical protein
MMTEILLEQVPDVAPSGTPAENAEGVAMVPVKGEAGRHRHAIRERVIMSRDESLARTI